MERLETPPTFLQYIHYVSLRYYNLLARLRTSFVDSQTVLTSFLCVCVFCGCMWVRRMFLSSPWSITGHPFRLRVGNVILERFPSSVSLESGTGGWREKEFTSRLPPSRPPLGNVSFTLHFITPTDSDFVKKMVKGYGRGVKRTHGPPFSLSRTDTTWVCVNLDEGVGGLGWSSKW